MHDFNSLYEIGKIQKKSLETVKKKYILFYSTELKIMTFTFHALLNTFNLLMSMKTCNSFYFILFFFVHMEKNYDDN